jgi:hypothetical protein
MPSRVAPQASGQAAVQIDVFEDSRWKVSGEGVLGGGEGGSGIMRRCRVGGSVGVGRECHWERLFVTALCGDSVGVEKSLVGESWSRG